MNDLCSYKNKKIIIKKKKKKRADWFDDAWWDTGWPMLVFTHMNFVSLLQHNILTTPMFCAFYNWFKMVFTLWSCSIILFVSSLIALNSWVLDMKLLFLLGWLSALWALIFYYFPLLGSVFLLFFFSHLFLELILSRGPLAIIMGTWKSVS